MIEYSKLLVIRRQSVLEIFLLIVGFGLLIFSANIFVEGNVKIAQKLKVPTLIISLTLVALGTSIPEAVVSGIAAINKSDIALANILGSDIANIAVVAGLTAIFFPIIIEKKLIKETLQMLIVEVILVILLVTGYSLNRFDGSILLLFLVLFILNMIKGSKNDASVTEEMNTSSKGFVTAMMFIKNEMVTVVTFIVLGILGLVYGGKIVVDNAVILAKTWGISEAVIGGTIVAVGTSLPELVTSIVAGFKKETDVIMGNIIGSNILNILFILGVSSCINPLMFTKGLWIQASVMIIYGIVLCLFAIRGKISRIAGLVLASSYIIFLLYL